ncbi:MAG TPA: M20 family metallopeptidase [Trueperaceae bacterium]
MPEAPSSQDLALRAAAAVDAERVRCLTQELVRIRSVFEPEHGNTEAAAARFLAGTLRDLGLEVTEEEAAPGRPNVIADWCGAGYQPVSGKTLMFEGHTDVVTEGDPGLWRHPPFEGRLEDGKIYGRGSADMKAGVAAAICALEAVRAVAPDLPGRIRLGIVADEEGMMQGIKHFIRQGWAEGVHGAIICEPEENELCLHQKGAMRVRAEFRGVMAHGAMPYAGINPITYCAAFIREVQDYQAREQARLGEHRYLGLPWLTPTIVQAPASGAAQHNVIPETASLALDIRTVPGQDHDEIHGALEDIATKVAAGGEGKGIFLERVEDRPWTETDAADPLVRALERAYPGVLGTTPRYGGVPGATDGTFLHAWAAVPIVTVGPGDRTIPHQRDEFVRLEEVVRAAQLYAAAAVEFLRADIPGAGE